MLDNNNNNNNNNDDDDDDDDGEDHDCEAISRMNEEWRLLGCYAVWLL
jgi:hypothetical protein